MLLYYLTRFRLPRLVPMETVECTESNGGIGGAISAVANSPLTGLAGHARQGCTGGPSGEGAGIKRRVWGCPVPVSSRPIRRHLFQPLRSPLNDVLINQFRQFLFAVMHVAQALLKTRQLFPGFFPVGLI